MALDIYQRVVEDIVILDLKGDLKAGEGSEKLTDTLRSLAAEGKTRAILNLKESDYIDSTGLGSMVVGFTTMKKAGGALKLVNLSQREIELLILTKLTTIFETFHSEVDAVNSFFPDRHIERFDILEFVQKQKKG